MSHDIVSFKLSFQCTRTFGNGVIEKPQEMKSKDTW